MLDEMNARHAREFAGCTKPETIALHREGAAAAAAAVRGLSDAELAETGTVFAGMPPRECRAPDQAHSPRPHGCAFRQHPEDDRRLSHLGAATLAPGTPGERHGRSTPESAFKLRNGLSTSTRCTLVDVKTRATAIVGTWLDCGGAA
jgi:hypothetical protein